MPKTPYAPTETDRATGANVRALRQRRGETLRQTVEGSGFGKDASTLAATERGERLLTDLEATKLAAHFNTTADQIRAYPHVDGLKATVGMSVVATEQAWLGNDKPALFAVPDPQPVAPTRTLTIDLDNPLTPDAYREQVWIPHLEACFARAYPHHKTA